MSTKSLSLSRTEALGFISNLSTMISAGIPILSTIDSLLEDSDGKLKKVLEVIHADLLQGKQLNTSLAKFPRIFNKITVFMLKASEESGTLDIALKDIKDQLKKDIEFNGKIRAAMAYPILVLLVFLGVMLLILTVVIPKIAQVFTQLKLNLPLPTKVLIFASNILLHYTIFLLLGIIIFIILLVFIYREKKEILFAILYRIPIVSRLISEIDLMHFSRSMYLLLRSGITINNALELTEGVVHKPEIFRAIRDIRETVLSGKTMSSSMKKKKKIFPSIMVKIIEAGEKTGSLDTSMQEVYEYLDYKIEGTLKNLITAMEPIMLVVVGILVGSMMLAIIGPIYSLIGQINPR